MLVYEMQSFHGVPQPHDLLNETHCTNLFTIPTPPGGFPDLLGSYAPYKRGWLVCGAYSADRTKCVRTCCIVHKIVYKSTVCTDTHFMLYPCMYAITDVNTGSPVWRSGRRSQAQLTSTTKGEPLLWVTARSSSLATRAARRLKWRYSTMMELGQRWQNIPPIAGWISLKENYICFCTNGLVGTVASMITYPLISLLYWLLDTAVFTFED